MIVSNSVIGFIRFCCSNAVVSRDVSTTNSPFRFLQLCAVEFFMLWV